MYYFKHLIFVLYLYSWYSAFADDNMVSYEIIDFEIPKPLTNQLGDPIKGKIIASSRKGNCLACHVIPEVDEMFHGTVGPSLKGVGSRYNINELRLRLVNPYILNPDSIMPAFYKVKGLEKVDKNFYGNPILNAQEIEDVISWLMTLKSE